MTTQSTDAVEQLLAATEAAHGVYETTQLGGVYDADWPGWYAAYAVEHGIGELIGRAVSVEELTGFLTRSWDELSSLDPRPSESWSTWTARRLVEEPA
jgi:hypothetical protein